MLRSTEVHPEFCGLSSPFFSNSYIQLCYWGSLAAGAVVVLVVPSSSLCLLCASLGTTITTALHLLLLEGCAVYMHMNISLGLLMASLENGASPSFSILHLQCHSATGVLWHMQGDGSP